MFCDRKYDCVNESRPGVTSTTLSPEQAAIYVDRIRKELPNLSVVGIAGPGDAFAEPERTIRTMKIISERHPDLLFCVSTNGFNAFGSLEALAQANVSHLTVTVNAVDTAIGAQIYAWARDGKMRYRGKDAAEELMIRQMAVIERATELGITVKVNSIVIPGVNDAHVPQIAKMVAQKGAFIFNAIPLKPVPNTIFGSFDEPTHEQIAKVREEAGKYLPQMTHCGRCRADAAGLLGERLNEEFISMLKEVSLMPDNPLEHRPYVAVASREGLLINQHLGEAEEFVICDMKDGAVTCIENRKAPPAGKGDMRWIELAETLKDCRAVLVSGVGANPRKIMEERGIRIHELEGLVEDGVKAVVSDDESINSLQKRGCSGCGKGTTCTGSGGGCG
jgi:nitrogen fixation protein NifB